MIDNQLAGTIYGLDLEVLIWVAILPYPGPKVSFWASGKCNQATFLMAFKASSVIGVFQIPFSSMTMPRSMGSAHWK